MEMDRPCAIAGATWMRMGYPSQSRHASTAGASQPKAKEADDEQVNG
jgi:hypothetical protein